MLGRHLHIVGAVYVAYAILILSYNARRFVKSSRRRRSEDKISALPDDLLVTILLFLPTKDAVATVVLSKRWQSVWTMLPQLIYMDKQGPEEKESIWWFLDQSLQLHKAPVVERLVIQLGPRCPVSADVRECLANVVYRRVHHLKFQLSWLSEPSSLPESLYVCTTLVCLTISDKIFVDAPSTVCLPSLKYLRLECLVYKDDDALIRLLSGCPVLKKLSVRRHSRDNLKIFRVKVPSLKTLFYSYPSKVYREGSLVIESRALRQVFHQDLSANSYSLENKPHLKKAVLNVMGPLDDNFRTSLSSVIFLDFFLHVVTVPCCHTITFSQLIECNIAPYNMDWLEPFMCFLQNSPNLKVLLIDQRGLKHEKVSLSFNPPTSVPGCLSNHLEIFEWEEYGGRNGEKQVVRYILANSKCLKRAGISIEPKWNAQRKHKVMKELASMPRCSTSSHLLFSTQRKYQTLPFHDDKGS